MSAPSSLERPECFGQPLLRAGSPCYACAAAGPCTRRATRDNPGGFGVMLWPRVAAPVSPDPGAPGVMTIDPEVTAPLAEFLARLGLHHIASTNTWKLAKTPVFVVEVANAARVVVRALTITPNHVLGLASAHCGAQFTPVYDAGVGDEVRTTVGAVQRRRIYATCTLITAPDWRSTAPLLEEIVRKADAGETNA